MSKFQLILLSVFGVFIIIGVIAFSTTKSSNSAAASTTVVWGDIPGDTFSQILIKTGGEKAGLPKVEYVYKPAKTFTADLTEAIAIGQGPDLIILPTTSIWKNRNKVYIIPEASLTQSDFKNTFMEEGELLTTTGGVYGLPLVVDPMVLYWNRDLFTKAALVAPPKFWDEIYGYADKLTEKDEAGNIQKSTIALGESKNIPNAKDIMSLLMLQAGTPITLFRNDRYYAVMNDNFNLPIQPAGAALDFFTQFSNPTKSFYSWNSALLPAQTFFTSGNTAMYLGYASELGILKAKNPTLNLGVALVPQSRISNKSLTYGRLRAVAVLKSSKNITGAFSTAFDLISSINALALSDSLLLPPARRDLLIAKPTDYFQSIFYTAGIQSKGWVDPDEEKTTTIFTDMIESVTSGRAKTQGAISNANVALDSLITP